MSFNFCNSSHICETQSGVFEKLKRLTSMVVRVTQRLTSMVVRVTQRLTSMVVRRDLDKLKKFKNQFDLERLSLRKENGFPFLQSSYIDQNSHKPEKKRKTKLKYHGKDEIYYLCPNLRL